jgi:hypothetical protein
VYNCETAVVQARTNSAKNGEGEIAHEAIGGVPWPGRSSGSRRA